MSGNTCESPSPSSTLPAFRHQIAADWGGEPDYATATESTQLYLTCITLRIPHQRISTLRPASRLALSVGPQHCPFHHDQTSSSLVGRPQA
jgi:hypothetical protein